MLKYRAYKPVAHQAPIVLTARLSNKMPHKCEGWEPGLKCYRHAEPGMLAFTDKKSMSYFPEPEYFVNVKGCDMNDFDFLGVVQTPAQLDSPNQHRDASDINVIHAGGTITTFHTGNTPIAANQLVKCNFPGGRQSIDDLPEMWKKSYDGKHCEYAVTEPVDLDIDRIENTIIIGRAIRRAEPGQQLLILAQ